MMVASVWKELPGRRAKRERLETLDYPAAWDQEATTALLARMALLVTQVPLESVLKDPRETKVSPGKFLI